MFGEKHTNITRVDGEIVLVEKVSRLGECDIFVNGENVGTGDVEMVEQVYQKPNVVTVEITADACQCVDAGALFETVDDDCCARALPERWNERNRRFEEVELPGPMRVNAKQLARRRAKEKARRAANRKGRR